MSRYRMTFPFRQVALKYVLGGVFILLCMVWWGLRTNYVYLSEGDVQVPLESFKPYTFTPEGVYTFSDVCIVENTAAPPVLVAENKSVVGKHIVVYNAKRSGSITLSVALSDSINKPRTWDLYLKKAPMPSSFKYKSPNHVAYFAMTTCTGNLYHLWEDTLVGLHGILKATNRLGSKHNDLYYRVPDISTYSNNCHSKDRYEQLMLTLGVSQGHDVFHAAESGTCYKYAVFGWKKSHSEEASDYLIDHIPMSLDLCKPKTVTFLQRDYRRLLNIDALVESVRELHQNYNIKVVTMEGMTFDQQYELIRCTDILVGVHGAGLHWLIFMRPSRGLIELGPDNFGNYYCKDYAGYRGLKTRCLKASKTVLNWKAVSEIHYHGRPLSEQQRQTEIQRYKLYKEGNPWKWADSQYDVKKFKEIFMSLAKDVFDD